ncbi:hypothetical protein COT44_03690 [Candidatus Shapirobacteria bacterium CG08_land_8_20_14_0_20_39_18]|uniref:PEGA domain-containing protein n=1 Tax=Candidatus Shapirobacteria bacterium CG08_land_8_20_14_0_20_39_18 TaxID=1974883 RepID=A0A2M6XC96_9BACT|nr:MAG: hypothetical protein COT44_03690 [Candidatus Shapirobacteria bacterium CG08_land_8_20_14_0_20_39_18]PIY64740.1 MAG: hypothetical protein COY91_04365 [Candidatus Shapirobacteria bacterium CG_4_10_14_0_8_um_filter_39_15]PJE67973.1 MAG: hypothetical protein COU94_04385 [Candidatus Shapirobacteria bacterium CG10_big_fil_rev_8_21_14_0_10_38_8]
MTHKRNIFFFLVVASILVTTYLVIKIAKGYKLDLENMSFQPTGLLVATSNPDGAKIWINGLLKGATNSTISLTPREYKVEIKKAGYLPWSKTLKLEKELVVQTNALLFPILPDLKALTFNGAEKPVISPDLSKVVYQTTTKPAGIWVLDLNDFPFGINRESRQIFVGSLRGRDLTAASYQWTPDSKQILLTFTTGKIKENFSLDSNTLTDEIALKDISQDLFSLNLQWTSEQKIRKDQQMEKLVPELADIIENKTRDLSFSPDETKILYTATASAQIPDNLIPAINGASTQKQERTIKPDHTYVYDIKEDKNFPLALSLSRPFTLSWFPTSRHLILVEKNKVTIMEYDGTNQTVVYNTPFVDLNAFSFPSGNRLLVLTTISSDPKAPANLYAVSLK